MSGGHMSSGRGMATSGAVGLKPTIGAMNANPAAISPNAHTMGVHGSYSHGRSHYASRGYGYGGLYAYEPGYNSCYDNGYGPYYNGYYNNCYYDYDNAPGPGVGFGW